MNREQKRFMESKQNKNIKVMKKGIRNEIIKRAEQQLNDGRVEAMMLCFVLALHREHGFEEDECLNTLRAVDSLMDPWIKSEYNLEELRDLVIREVGIDIKC